MSNISATQIGNVQVDVTCELGRKCLTLREIRRLKVHDTVELEKLAGESMEVRVNGRRFALGEIVVVAERMAVRLTALEPVPKEGSR